MSRDEIYKLASRAGIAKYGLGFCCWEGQLERFAALVAEAEREACAKAIEKESGRWAVPVTSADYREIWAECAAAIRARGDA